MQQESAKPIKNVFISVFHKEGLDQIVRLLNNYKVRFYSSGGTQSYLQKQGVEVTGVEDLTGYPSILGGRVKTLHPNVFGGLLYRSNEPQDMDILAKYSIPAFDLVIVDLYPFEETLKSGADHQSIIEKIDIGGISLIRAASKNFQEVMVVPGQEHYSSLVRILEKGAGQTTLEERRIMASRGFQVSARYDSLIAKYMGNGAGAPSDTEQNEVVLRYGENPHQKAAFIGNLEELLEQLHGKQLSYNNLLDVDASVSLIEDFTFQQEGHALAIIKHTNPCGFAVASDGLTAWNHALEADPVSAFGGIIAANYTIEKEVAEEINKLFYEILIAPDFTEDALNVLKSKKNRIILKKIGNKPKRHEYRSVLNGALKQEQDLKVEVAQDLKPITKVLPDKEQINDMTIASRLVKHTKSNGIVLVKNGRIIGSGTGQTSRVDALKQAIEKATRFSFDTRGGVMASDAFFPFPDCVEIGAQNGIAAIVQPGGSKNDQASIDKANENGIAMVFTQTRHFKH